MGHFGLFWALLGPPGPYRPVPSRNPSKSHLFWAILGHFGPFGPFWALGPQNSPSRALGGLPGPWGLGPWGPGPGPGAQGPWPRAPAGLGPSWGPGPWGPGPMGPGPQLGWLGPGTQPAHQGPWAQGPRALIYKGPWALGPWGMGLGGPRAPGIRYVPPDLGFWGPFRTGPVLGWAGWLSRDGRNGSRTRARGMIYAIYTGFNNTFGNGFR